MFIRYQTMPYLDDFNVDFLEATISTWGDHGIHAARCFGIGA